MKKIYQIPNTIVVNIQTTQIMTGSLEYYDDPNAATTETSGNLSRRRGFSIWGDDDNDE